jgi:hypothetical protein
MSNSPEIEDLRREVTALHQRVGRLEDEMAVRRLQFSYGYYLDKCLYDEVVDLFAEDGDVIFMRGHFKGKAGVRRLYIERFRKNFTNDYNGPVFGFLLDHPQLQDIVTVAPDGQSARGRFRSCMQAGRHMLAEGETRQWWEGGIYENQYVKIDGRWRIKLLNYRPVFHATFENGWAYTKPQFVPFYTEDDLYPDNPLGPDAIDDSAVLWPETDVVPFHYGHPITDAPWQG